jgi:hypothetical protein
MAGQTVILESPEAVYRWAERIARTAEWAVESVLVDALNTMLPSCGRIQCINEARCIVPIQIEWVLAMTLIITLDEAMTVQLRQQAAARQVSMEECAMQLLSEAVAQLADTIRWQQYNQRRVALIHKSAITSLSREEAAELEALQAALDQRLAPMDEQLLTVVADMQRTVAALPDNAQP